MRARSPKIKLSYVCNTHNPAGRVMTEEELRGIAVDEGFYVFVDELWEDILTATSKEDHERGPGPASRRSSPISRR
jgi:aspartate/methionine/tyrosine aminotransferase